MSFGEDNGSQSASVSVQTSGKPTFKDYAFYGVIGFFCLSALGSIMRMIDPENWGEIGHTKRSAGRSKYTGGCAPNKFQGDGD